MIRLIECPRDAMQGWKDFIPTARKVQYISALLQVGFDTIDFGSFVSPKWIPQMADTKDVLRLLDLSGSRSRLLAIVANLRGAEEASVFDEVSLLGFPFSVSETFQKLNTNRSITESLDTVKAIQELCLKSKKDCVVYLSMAFGNPYGDAYSQDQVLELAGTIAAMGVKTMSLADTVGLAAPEQVGTMTRYLVQHLPGVEVGVHLHSTALNREAKLAAALEAGCYRFDGALKGVGGCPMAGDSLVGNMPTERMIEYFKARNMLEPLNEAALAESLLIAADIFHN